MGLHWLQCMSVGVREFDRDHQDAILLLDGIAVALTEGDGDRARALAEGLQALAADHVDREEAFLRRIGFPGVDAVTGAQRDNLSRIADLAGLIKGADGGGRHLAAAMGEAFVSYLLRADINYKSYVEAAGLADVG